MSNLIESLNLEPGDLVVLAIGLILGLSVIAFIRSRQVWSARRAFGYDVYTAARMRQWLTRFSLIGVGVSVAVIGVYIWWTNRPTQTGGGPAAEIVERQEVPDTLLLIPRLAVEAKMIESPIVAQQWDISRLRDEVAHLEGTAYPGEPGNTVLAGHITIPDAGWGPFRDLHTLQPGDQVFIERGEATYVYQVREVLLVEPTAVEVAYPTPHNQLTLITCSGWSDILQAYVQRVVVIADQLQ